MAIQFDHFVAQYAKAYDAYDAERIAGFVASPCLFLRQDRAVVLESAAKTREFLATTLGAYHDAGCANFGAALVEGRQVGTRSAVVAVDWNMTNAEGTTVMRFRTTYNLVHDAGHWKINVITRHD